MKTIYCTILFLFFISEIAFSCEYTSIMLNNKLVSCNYYLPDSIAIDNPYIRVLRNSTACKDPDTPGFGSRITVALSEIKVESSKGSVILNRGEVAVFLHDESYKMPQEEYFEVANKEAVFKTISNKKIIDFEDGLEYYSALESGCQAIVTEDQGDFHFSEIELVSCREFMAKYL